MYKDNGPPSIAKVAIGIYTIGIHTHAWTKCGIWESYSRKILLLEGNLYFEGIIFI